MHLWIAGLISFGFFVFSTQIQAADPSQDWKTLVTEHFLIHHLDAYSEQAKISAFIAEQLYPKLEKKLSWSPEGKISLLITDENDSSNGAATAFPFNLAILRLMPPDNLSQLEDYDDWLSLLLEHELTHVFHLDKSSGAVSALRKIFGRHPLLFPNTFQPRWLTEGLATYYETHDGIGRGQSSSFEMMMREELVKGLLPVSKVNLPPQSHPLNRPYLYGVYFYQFLKDRYGEDAINQLIQQYSNNLLPFAINSNSKSVFGKDITALWSEFSVYLQKRFSPQLTLLNNSALKQGALVDTVLNQLTTIGFLGDGSMVYIENDFESPARLIKLKHSEKTTLAAVTDVSDIGVDAKDNVYFSQANICEEYYMYSDLYRYDISSGDVEQLTHCERYKYFAIAKASNRIAAVRTVHSIPQIDILDANGALLFNLWKGKYGDVINKIDWSEKRNKLLVTRKQLNQSWHVYEYDLPTNNWAGVITNDAINMQARYSNDEKSVLFSSDLSGVYNIYQYSFSDESVFAITNVVTGALSPAQGLTNDVFYLDYQRGGFSMRQTNLDKAVVPSLKEPVKPDIRATEDMFKAMTDYPIRDYSPWADLKPGYWFPWFLIQDQGGEVGFSTSSNDALQNHFYALNIAYGYDREELVGTFYYQYANWFGLFVGKENTVFTDPVTDLTNTVRSNFQWQALFAMPFTKFHSRWGAIFGLTEYVNTDTYRADASLGFEDSKDGVVGLSFYFDNKQEFFKSHSFETGRDVLLLTESSDAFDNDYSGQLTMLDWKEYFRLGEHHVLALRAVGATADTTMRPFSLGGLVSAFDASSLLNGQSSQAIFNKRSFSLRGYDENIQTGNNLEKFSLEWRFPLSYVEKGIMAPPLGIMKHSARIFTEAGSSWFDDMQKNSLRSAGVEWLLEGNIFYHLNLLFRFGYAKGLDDLGEEVYYLELGSAF
ncbi:MAG: hypothetical protein OEY11_03590 [Gammaproteobacteria bacterium]|nr:hypothetical protein [Gammaproteobacteria bacterium]